MTARLGGLFYLKGMIHLKSSLIINSIDQNGKAKSKTITNLNPTISNDVAGEFAQKVTALTTNTYTGARRVQAMDVTEPFMWGGA